ncbi:MAG TPA: hypothetical protein VGD81_09580 [Opitutaceae bacterium]
MRLRVVCASLSAILGLALAPLCRAEAVAAPAADAPPPETATTVLAPVFGEATVETAKTSIYVGSVTLAMPPFQRGGATYASTYSARVFPYFFYNESGRIAIDIPDADLRRLAAGETIHFTGRAENNDGEPRRVEGRAVPADAHSGRIKVRVWVTSKIELIFNTTYRFTGDAGEPARG